MDEKVFDLGFSLSPGVGPKRYLELLAYCGTSKDAWNASDAVLRMILGKTTSEKFISFRDAFSPQVIHDLLEKKNILYVTYSSLDYPTLLRTIGTPPIVLYAQGNTKLLRENSQLLGVVGTRKVTAYGRQVTVSFVTDLVRNGMTIVSGMALGVDAIAHTVAIQEEGETIAVLGSGIDICHPEANRHIYHRLQKHGLLISEYPPGTPPSTGSFPSRNRIIAGISIGVLVTEGAEDSGSLITAENAFSYKRKVYAVPGPVTSSLSAGPNKLLKKGAIFATSAQDILHDLQIVQRKKEDQIHHKGENAEERLVISLLINEALSFDEMVRITNLTPEMLSVTLSYMEIRSIVEQVDGKYTLVI